MLNIISKIFPRRVVLFLCFGGLAAIVNLIVGKLLYDVVAKNIPYAFSVFIGALAGLLVNFLGNYYFNFTKHPRKIHEHFRTFAVVALIGTVLTALLSYVFRTICYFFGFHVVEWLGVQITANFASHFVAIGIVTFYSYFAHKHFSFDNGIRKGISKTMAKWKK